MDSVTIDSIIYGQNFNLICTYINFSNDIHENIALFLQVLQEKSFLGLQQKNKSTLENKMQLEKITCKSTIMFPAAMSRAME